MPAKTCFFVSPIGEESSDIRWRSDLLLERLIKPAIDSMNFTAIRADELADPGRITDKIINMALHADLVIADLTGHNANVFYELATRHAAGKPFVHLASQTERLPFDIADWNTLFLPSLERSMNEHRIASIAGSLVPKLRRAVEGAMQSK